MAHIAIFIACYRGGQFRLHLHRILSVLILLTFIIPPLPAASVSAAAPAQVTPPPESTPIPAEPTPSATLPAAEELPTAIAASPTGEAYPAPPDATPTAAATLPAPTPTFIPTLVASLTPTTPPSEGLPAPTEPVSITLSANPFLLPGEELYLEWRLGGWSSALRGAQLILTAPSGFTPLPGSPGSFDSATGRLSLTPQDGDGQISWSTPRTAEGPFPLSASLMLDGRELAKRALVIQEEGLNQVSLAGGTASGFGGKVTVEFPPGAADQAMTVRVRRIPPAEMPAYTLSGAPFEVIARSQDTRQEIHAFSQPITITLAYDEASLDGEESALSLFYFDEAAQSWTPLPSWVDAAQNLLHATSTHLTQLDYDIQKWQAARLPSMDGAQVTQYTGAAGYSYPLWTPPGPGGLQPSLSLSYNSQVIDSANADTQASWVGFGWSLETGAIERDMHETNDNLTDDTYRISLGGVSGMLLKDSGGVYHTAGESFMRIQYDPGSDVWTAWDKQGTQYIFGSTDDSRARYPRCTGSNPKVELVTYRWSLKEVKNVFQQSLTYTYSEESKNTKLSCDTASYTTELASYPLTIDYPHSHYQVYFELDPDDRRDYHSGWEDLNSLVFYQKSRLAAVVIKHDNEEVKSYNLGYNSDPLLFPGILWDNTGKNFTLIQIEEVGLNGDTSLPETQFTYDNLHLTQVTNGYGGSVTFDYEPVPWTDVTNSDKRKHANDFSYCNLANQGASIPGWSGGTCIGEGNMKINGDVTHQSPASFTQPGAEYLLQVRIRPNTDEGKNGYAEFGYRYGSSRIILGRIDFLGSGSFRSAEARFYLPETADKLTMLVTSSWSCSVDYYHLTLMPTRYRVDSKTLSDAVTSTENTFTYAYDEPATNDIQHSLAVSTTTTSRYVPAYSEFRGHAMTRESGPEGRTVWTWFHQDDARQGKAHATLVGDPSYIQPFNSTSWNDYSSEWNYNGAVPLFERLHGDTAAKITNPNTNWDIGLYRNLTTPSLSSGESALVSFLVSDTTSTQTILAVANGSGVGYQRRGIKQIGNSLYFHKCDGGYDPNTHCSDPQLILPNFERGRWYVLLLSLDVAAGNDRIAMRVWERDDPVKSAQYVETLTGVALGGWRFLQKTYDGVAWLDEYSELQAYSLSETLYDRDSDNEVQPYQPPSSELKIYWTRPVTETLYTYEGDGDWVGTMKRYEYNASEQRQVSLTAQYGNLTRLLESQWDAAQGAWRDYRLTRTIYYWNTSGVYLVGLPGIQKQYACQADSFNQACSPSGTPSDADILAEQWFLYDNQTSFSATPSAGKLTGRRTLLYCASDACLSTGNRRYSDESYAYDAWGNRTAVTRYTGDGSWSSFGVGTPQQTSWTYDSSYHTYRLSETLPETPGGTLTTNWTYTYTLGLLADETDPNYVSTYATYDNFGRLKKIIRPGDSLDQPTFKVEYSDTAPFYTTATQKVDTGVNYVQRKYYNGLGQLLQSRIIGATLSTGQRDVLVDYYYDAYGRIVSQSTPYDVDPTSGFARTGTMVTQTSYDILGRPLSVTAPDGTVQTMVYSDTVSAGLGYLETRLTDANGHTTRTLSDMWGRTAQVLPPAGPSVSYDYDIFDQMTNAYRDDATTTITYDKAGRKTQMDDPDMGVWEYTYDALGNLKTQTDARGCTTTLGYDPLNRLTSKTYTGPGACDPTPDVSYTYDAYDPANGQYGRMRRTGMSDGSGTTAWKYDGRGRVVQEVKVISGSGTFKSEWWYNSADLVAWMKYPADNNGNLGEALVYGYHPQMLVNSVTGTSTYVKSTSYDAAGRVDVRLLGDSGGNAILRSDSDYFDWDESNGSGRLKRIKSEDLYPTVTLLQDLRYYDTNTGAPFYDAVGNLGRIDDYKNGISSSIPQSQYFTYDNLYRITSASASNGWNDNGNYTTESYSYDSASGNLESKTGVGTYDYATQSSSCPEGALASRPHAVTSTVGATTTLYCYDQNGNMTRRDPSGAAVYNFQYDAESRMVAVSGSATASFVFDGDGNRVKSTAGGVTRVHIGAYFEWTGSTSTMKKYYSAGGARVAVRTGASTLNFILTDHLGSTSITTNSSGTLLTDNRYKAWGESRYASGTLPTKFTYTGQYSNVADFGLMYYGARWYDSALSRFAQADSIIPQPGNPLAWDRYAAMMNNPLRYIDPTGYSACDGAYADPECDPNYQDPWVIPIPTNVIVLAGAVFTETSNGNYPEDEMAAIAWVYSNRVASGVFPSLIRAVGPGQSALIAALSGDFHWLADLLSLSQLDLSINMYQMHLALSSGGNSAGWQVSLTVSIKVSRASSSYGYGSSNDPTGGATDFKVKSPAKWREHEAGYVARVDDPNWPSYHYLPRGPFWVDTPLGKWIYLVLDNISFVTRLNPRLLEPLDVDNSD